MKHFKYGTLARRYATAVFDLAHEDGRVDEVKAEITVFGEALNKVPQLLRALEDKEIQINIKKRVVGDVSSALSLSPLVTNTIKLLVEKGRISIFDAILSSYTGMAEIFERMARAEARIADKILVGAFKDKIEKILSEALKKKTVCETIVDESLIGGAVVKVGDIAIDASIAGRLDRMKEELLSS